MKITPNDERNAAIRTAGIVQAVIASGAPTSEWRKKAAYGLDLADYMRDRYLGRKAKRPTAPNFPKETDHGQGQS